jgi:hypothetical protein
MDVFLLLHTSAGQQTRNRDSQGIGNGTKSLEASSRDRITHQLSDEMRVRPDSTGESLLALMQV